MAGSDLGRLLQPSDVATLSGCVSIVLVTTNVLRHAFDLNPRLIGLCVAAVCAAAQASLTPSPTWITWFLVVPNALLIYAGATGIAGVTGKLSRSPRRHSRRPSKPNGDGAEETPELRPVFWEEWW
jgi:hypothetical protein